MSTDHHDRLGSRELVGDRIEHGHELRTDDEHLGLRVVGDVGDFRWRQTPVDVDAHGVDQRASVEHLEVLDAVLVEERHPILTADPRGLERLGHLTRALVQLRP